MVEKILSVVQDQELFLTLSIHDILWGYEDNLLKKVKEVAATFHVHLDLDDHFGLFYNVSLISVILIFLFLSTFVSENKHWGIQKGQSKMDNLEKLATQGTQYEEKHNTTCVGHHYAQANTNNVNKT